MSSSFEYGFDRQDHKDFQEYNLRYVIETSVDKLIKTWYRKPEEGEEGIFCQSEDVMHDLVRARKIPRDMGSISAKKIGTTLKNQGYKNKSKRGVYKGKKGTRYGYLVIPLYDVQKNS
ncbi:hypothetical protein EZS27_028851 [termite gut metagenome]|uniref:Uncharacterized protein n=1 Tax=termite gut metagenome TaxID=433724 RepID=A0A5J4QHW9_9ZZZZ